MARTGARETQSVVDGLKTVFVDLAQLQLAPDAGQHAPFLQAMQQGIQRYLQEQEQMKATQAAHMQHNVAAIAARGQQPPGQPPGGGMPGLGAPPGGPPGPPPAQGMPGLQLPNPDELRRMLQTSGAS